MSERVDICEGILVYPGDGEPPFGEIVRVMVNGVEIWQVPLRQAPPLQSC